LQRISTKKYAQHKREFRGSIYVDLSVDWTENLEADRITAEQMLIEIAEQVGGDAGKVAYSTHENPLTLDREI